ncbi:hypothetical protein [Paradevosia shaoguanensis]|uniref:hypothetical protein n=1 Tax=Paradevosia shaoguanensis TaxID=1335043 RepID=UPI001933CC57|nr:hypothetical protein [Paradevosia shaoguanensis]
MSWDYFDRVTGSTEYERQSWRDSYNGGWAAGDWTGNTNARIAAEREAFNGATWEGSSSQPSALEWARMGGGLSLPAGGAGSSQTAGPGNPRAGTSGAVAQQGAGVGSGPGSGLVLTVPKGGEVKDQPLKRIGHGGPQEALGAISDIGWVRTTTGWTSIPSSDVKERIEDDIFQEMSWMWRNKIAPDLMLTPQPFPEFLGDPKDYQFNSFLDEWQVRPKANGGRSMAEKMGEALGGVLTATPEADLPNPLSYPPMSSW